VAARDLKFRGILSDILFRFKTTGKLAGGREGLKAVGSNSLAFSVVEFNPNEQPEGGNEYASKLGYDTDQIDVTSEWPINIQFSMDLTEAWVERRKRIGPLELRAFEMNYKVRELSLLLKTVDANHPLILDKHKFEFRYSGLDYVLDFVEGEGAELPSFIDSRHATICGINQFSCFMRDANRLDPARVQSWSIIASTLLGVILGAIFTLMTNYWPIGVWFLIILGLLPVTLLLFYFLKVVIRRPSLKT